MKARKIQTGNGRFEIFQEIDLDVSVGDTIYWNNGDGYTYGKGIVTAVDPDHWWIYDDGEKVLGCVTAVTEGGENYRVDFCDIMAEPPAELNYDYIEPSDEHEVLSELDAFVPWATLNGHPEVKALVDEFRNPA